MRDAGNQEMIVDVQAQTIRCGIRELIGPALLLRRAAAGASPSYPAGVFRSHLRSSRRQGSCPPPPDMRRTKAHLGIAADPRARHPEPLRVADRAAWARIR